MSLAKPSGSETTSSLVSSNRDPITQDDIRTATRDTFLNRTSISSLQNPDALNTLLARIDGVRTQVLYFRKTNQYINNQLGATSFSLERSAVHMAYDQINDFEIIIDGQVEVTPNPETGEFEASGRGYIYPGFKPNSGDLFYMTLLDSQIGVFVIDQVTKLAISRSSYYEVTFFLYGYLTSDIELKIQESVRDQLYFDKDKYFVDTITLLTDDSYNTLQELKKYRTDMVERYIALFYNREASTVVSKDGLYDPNLANFLISKIPQNQVNIFQLTSAFAKDYDTTIWRAILDRSMTWLSAYSYAPCRFVSYAWDAYMTLADRFTIAFLKDTDDGEYDKRLVPIKFREENGLRNYHFSYYLYYALKYRFETGTDPINIPTHAADWEQYFHLQMPNNCYSVVNNSYLPFSDIFMFTIADGSNNDLGLSELEYMVYDLIVNGRVDTMFFTDAVISKFPYEAMTDADKFYLFPVLIHLADVSIAQLR